MVTRLYAERLLRSLFLALIVGFFMTAGAAGAALVSAHLLVGGRAAR